MDTTTDLTTDALEQQLLNGDSKIATPTPTVPPTTHPRTTLIER
ncbi:MAG: hypothetical protein ACNYZH_00090 [Acidimicrobiia bacterium]